MKKMARALRMRRELLLNGFLAEGEIPSGTIEGFNNKAKLTMGKAYGFRPEHVVEVALFYALGDLHSRKSAHKFC